MQKTHYMKKLLSLLLSLFFTGTVLFAQVATDDTLLYGRVDVDAEFPGGMEELVMFACMNIEYPEQAQKANIEGKVFARFCVEKDGSVSNIRILKDIGYGCGDAVVKMLKSMPRWKPAKVDGKNVREEFSLPVNFILSDDENIESKEVRCRAQAQLYSKSVPQDE